jgi:hypothetical protein
LTFLICLKSGFRHLYIRVNKSGFRHLYIRVNGYLTSFNYLICLIFLSLGCFESAHVWHIWWWGPCHVASSHSSLTPPPSLSCSRSWRVCGGTLDTLRHSCCVCSSGATRLRQHAGTSSHPPRMPLSATTQAPLLHTTTYHCAALTRHRGTRLAHCHSPLRSLVLMHAAPLPQPSFASIHVCTHASVLLPLALLVVAHHGCR